MKISPLSIIPALMMTASLPLFATTCSTQSLTDNQTISPLTSLSVPGCTGGLTFVVAQNQPFSVQTGKLVNGKYTNKGQDNGQIREAVYKENSTGYLDFFYQVTNCGPGNGAVNCSAPKSTGVTGSNRSQGAITSFTITDFTGVLTSVGYLTKTGTGAFGYTAAPTDKPFLAPAADAPSSAQRLSIPQPDTFPGNQKPNPTDAITFTFASKTGCSACGAIGIGQNSAIILVRTNAISYDALGDAVTAGHTNNNGLNGADLALDSYEPSAVAPEPAFYGMMGFGIAGLVMAIRRRRSATSV